jgi:lysophospholipase L1-like esterase
MSVHARGCFGVGLRALLAALAALLLVELAVRWIAPDLPQPAEVRWEELPSGEVRLLFGAGETEGEVVRATVRAAPEVRRIVVAGDSTIFGTYLREHSTIPRLLAAQIQAATGVACEALNLGQEGIVAEDVCALALAALERLQPDVLVVYTGHNEFLTFNVNDVLAEQARPFVTWLGRNSGWSASLRRLHAILSRENSEAPEREFAGARTGGILERSVVAPLREHIHANFQRSLESLARAAARRSVPVVFVGPTSNGREYGPMHSAFSRDLDAANRRLFVAHLRAAVEALDAKDTSTCRERLDEAAAIDDAVGELTHQRARLSWSLGRADAAKLDRDKWGLDEVARAASSAVIERMEAAARATGAEFVHVGPALERAPTPGEPRLFLDHVHPSVYGQHLIAVQLLPVVARALELSLSQPALNFEQACRQLEIPAEFLERSDLFAVRGFGAFAYWAFDPKPYLESAKTLLSGFGERATTDEELLGADLFLALLEGDAERVQARVAALEAFEGAALRETAALIAILPRLRRRIGELGLELASDERGPTLRRSVERTAPKKHERKAK